MTLSPIDIIKNYIAKGMTPKEIVMSMAGNNPMLNNLVNMVDKGDSEKAETFVRNVLKEKGLDYDQEMENMKKVLNFK